jgi:hypothetical protein
MPSSGTLRRVALVRSNVSEECIASMIRVFLRSVLRSLVTAYVVPRYKIHVTLMMEAIRSSKTSVLTAAQSNITADGNLHSHRRENLKF